MLTLAGVLAGALVVPMPSLPDDNRAAVRTEVRNRLPGWRIERVDPSWEGGYTVVASCEGLEIGFQYVRGHGLPADDAWIQPNDDYSRDRLTALSDHFRHLVWYAERRRPKHLSCRDELARLGDPPAAPRNFD
jgi:hypothetical protein